MDDTDTPSEGGRPSGGMARPARIDAEALVGDIADLVELESPTEDQPRCARALDHLGDLLERRTGRRAEVVVAGGRTHLLLRPTGPATVLLLGHIDTVWAAGTLTRWPVTVDGDRLTGPGSFDMKGGLAMGVHAMAALGGHPGVGLLCTSDEETGSATSQAMIEDVARQVDAVLVLEPAGPGGAVKVARKGVSLYRARIHGRAAHAGLEPERGVNALAEMAAQVPRVMALADPAAGTTVTPTVARAGTTMNTVPAEAMFRIDVRTQTVDEQDRVAAQLAALTAVVPGARVEVEALGTRPPLEPGMSGSLLAVHERVAAELGLVLPPPMTSGGGSDGNFTAGVGTPTLDGLGAVGDGAHAEGEHISVRGTSLGAEVLTAVLERLLADGVPAT